MASKEMQAYLKLLAPTTVENVTVVTPKELGCDYLLHVSTNPKIPAFIPMVSQRTLNKEDRTVPRVCTAKTIVGCLKGYQAQVANFHNQEPITVYALPFEEALVPGTKLLPDVKVTDEVWLVGYSAKYRAYKPMVIGELFINTLKYYATGMRTYDAEFYAKVDKPFNLTSERKLDNGFYRFIIHYDTEATASKINANDITPISKAEYTAAKKAGKMVPKGPPPPSSKW